MGTREKGNGQAQLAVHPNEVEGTKLLQNASSEGYHGGARLMQ